MKTARGCKGEYWSHTLSMVSRSFFVALREFRLFLPVPAFYLHDLPLVVCPCLRLPLEQHGFIYVQNNDGRNRL